VRGALLRARRASPFSIASRAPNTKRRYARALLHNKRGHVRAPGGANRASGRPPLLRACPRDARQSPGRRASADRDPHQLALASDDAQTPRRVARRGPCRARCQLLVEDHPDGALPPRSSSMPAPPSSRWRVPPICLPRCVAPRASTAWLNRRQSATWLARAADLRCSELGRPERGRSRRSARPRSSAGDGNIDTPEAAGYRRRLECRVRKRPCIHTAQARRARRACRRAMVVVRNSRGGLAARPWTAPAWRTSPNGGPRQHWERAR